MRDEVAILLFTRGEQQQILAAVDRPTGAPGKKSGRYGNAQRALARISGKAFLR